MNGSTSYLDPKITSLFIMDKLFGTGGVFWNRVWHVLPPLAVSYHCLRPTSIPIYLMRFLMFLFSLSGNKGLCGVPSLPDCPLFWGSNGLSTGGKIAIGISSLILFCMLSLAVYVCCIRRRRYDYDFSLPQELMGKCIIDSYLPDDHSLILFYFAYLIEGTLFSCRVTTQHLLHDSVIS